MKKWIWVLILVVSLGFSYACTTAKNTGTAVKEGTEAGAKKTGEAAENVGQKVEDGSITAAVKAKFANDELVKASTIDVDTKDGYVTLNGTVASQGEADRAVTLARTVDGVKEVRSNLIVEQHQ